MKKGLFAFLLIVGFCAFSQTKVPPTRRLPPPSKEMMHWRGRRMQKENGGFFIKFVRAGKIENGKLCVDFIFNRGIDPRSVNAPFFFVDGKPLSSDVRFLFSKKGDKIRVFVPAKNGGVSIFVDGIRSFDGQKIKPISIEKIEEMREIRFFDEEKSENSEHIRGENGQNSYY